MVNILDIFGLKDKKKEDEAKTPALTPEQKAQQASVDLAVSKGPTAYTDAMRANLGFAPAGAAPAAAMPTGMATTGSQPYWANAATSQPPTLEQVLGIYTPPPPAPTPETPDPATPPDPNPQTPMSKFLSLLLQPRGRINAGLGPR